MRSGQQYSELWTSGDYTERIDDVLLYELMLASTRPSTQLFQETEAFVMSYAYAALRRWWHVEQSLSTLEMSMVEVQLRIRGQASRRHHPIRPFSC